MQTAHNKPLPPIPPPEPTSQKDAPLAQRRSRLRACFIAAVIGLLTGSVAAFVGDKMFALRSRGADSSQEVVAQTGNWEALGFGGSFLILCTLPVLIYALTLWWREK